MNPGTLLYRQVHSSWIRGEMPTSQAFTPTPKDEMKLSVYDGDEISAVSSWEHYSRQGLSSDGIVAVSVEDCENLGLKVIPDPKPGSPHHALIDFGQLTRGQVKRVAQRLTATALSRGWQFRPIDNP